MQINGQLSSHKIQLSRGKNYARRKNGQILQTKNGMKNKMWGHKQEIS